MKLNYNYLQPIYLEYTKGLTEGIVGYMMPFPNLERFKAFYGEPEENAPTNSLLDTIRLLLPQIRVINNLWVENQPNPAAFLAYKPIDPKILALIFEKWVEICYPESEHEVLKSLCSADQFQWTPASSNELEFWAPSWAIALQLSEYEYQLGENRFKFLFGPGRGGNMVELVSWPPFQNTHGHRTSIALVVSTQSDINYRKINLHFQMKRWIVKQGETPEVRLKKNTTRCYIRRLRSWLGDYTLLEPNAFTVLEANYRKEGDNFVPQWKKQQVLRILERLSVQIPAIADILANPLNFIETNHIDMLIPARSSQKAGWGTGVPFFDERQFLKQIKDILPSIAMLTTPWKKIPIIDNLKQSLKQRFTKIPIIAKPSAVQLPNIPQKLQEFLVGRANNLTIKVCYRTDEVKEALETVVQHYFGNSLKLEFQPAQGLADCIIERESKQNRQIADDRHIKQFGKENQPDSSTPMIMEILSPDHPLYRNNIDPKPYLKSLLPQYSLIPQCILSSEMGVNPETGEAIVDEELQDSLYNRALNAILDAIVPFTQNYPLSNPDDKTVYTGFYVIRRNRKTARQSFSEPVLVVIYKNGVSVLLPERDLKFRSMSDAICQLAKSKTSNKTPNQVIDNMFTTLSQNYSDAEDIYLFTHGQNSRQYWTWLQDSIFDYSKPPTRKIHIIRIRDDENNEVPQAYGLTTEQEIFEKDVASFAQGIFIPANYQPDEALFTQTVLSIAGKPDTNQKSKNISRFETWTSRRYEKETNEDEEIINKRDPQTGKCIVIDTPHNPSPRTNWKAPRPRAHNILATPSPDKFQLHHAITHHLRSCHWWTSDECAYPLPLSLARKLKEWSFNESELVDLE